MIFDELSKDNCVFFLILSIFSFVAFLLILFTGIKGKPNWKLIMASTTPLISYYIYLLLYSMCVRSL